MPANAVSSPNFKPPNNFGKLSSQREREAAGHATDERHAALERQRQSLADQDVKLRAREDELARLREEWIGEKLEVEEVIRSLLAQLGQQAEAKATKPEPAAE